jgi:hypothetical protein
MKIKSNQKIKSFEYCNAIEIESVCDKMPSYCTIPRK